jgi:hypothetical protein
LPEDRRKSGTTRSPARDGSAPIFIFTRSTTTVARTSSGQRESSSRQTLVIPGGIISLVIAGFCAIWRPDYMMKGIYSFVVCLALLFVIKSADFLVNLLQQELG